MAVVAVAFDTLKAATRLQKAGFGETQARVLVSTFAEAMVENLATKDDIADLRGGLGTKEEIAKLATREEIAKLATEEEIAKLATKEEIAKLATKEDLATLRGEVATKEELANVATKEELAILRGEMKQTAANLRTEISKVQERLTVRLGGAIAAAVAVLVAVDKLL